MKRSLILAIFSTLSLVLVSQGTHEDYKRAFSLNEKFRDKVFYSGISPHWIGKSNTFWYISNTPEGRIYTLVDVNKKTKKTLFDHQKLASALTEVTGKKVDATKLDIKNINAEMSDILLFEYDNRLLSFEHKTSILKKAGQKAKQKLKPYWGTVNEEKKSYPLASPNKACVAYVKDNNVMLKSFITNEEIQLTTDGKPDNYYSVHMWWSPDSRKLAVMKIVPAEIRKLYMIESSPADQLQPKLLTRDYRKPGDQLPQRTPVVIDIATKKALIANDSLFKNQYSLYGFDWSNDSKTVLFEFNQRGHQVIRVLEMSAESGNVRTVIEESSNTFVNYNRLLNYKLKNGTEIIWMSERDNYNHLYMYDRTSGKVKNQITKGQWYVREVINIDEKNREIIFSANGMVANEDPYLIRYYRIGFNGKGLTCLTPATGTHQAWFSDDKKLLVDVYSMVDKAPVAVVRDARNGKMVMTLEKADISALEKAGWRAPESFSAKGRDGETDIWGIIHRPTNFDPTKKYPVIEYIYAGPGSHYVPKNFISFNNNLSAIAELGFIVIQIDGMGTSFRSKSFEDVIHKNLKDAGFADRILWTKAAAAKYPYMDIDKVGIFGSSAGGQAAMWAVLFHPEHYKAAYSACGCHDNRMDKIWWNEQWMGYPVGPEYAACSNVDNAHLLTRPLMLVVGELDDNVDPASTYQVANALIKSKIDFELVTLPGVGHTMGGAYGEHKRFDFFVKHLMQKNPPAWTLVR
ncbi:MAG: DPP IV N-terminal domain-containing protein [Paludibacteraceae bacterium]|nr:DPP IV N-terminal domain-containing protein [Paludibacteraceae bacterium]